MTRQRLRPTSRCGILHALEGTTRRASRRAVFGKRRYCLGGDLLHAVDGHVVAYWIELRVVLDENYRVGDEVTVALFRKRGRHEVTVRLAKAP